MNDQRNNREHYRRSNRQFSNRLDPQVASSIKKAEEVLKDEGQSCKIFGLNAFQRKQLYSHFEKTQEFKAKSYKENDGVVVKVYPVGKIKRLAEQKAQEVLMQGLAINLPAMSSFERFVVHDYLKEREGIQTQSFGEGKERYIQISPQFGRSLKKVKRKLT